MRRARSSHRFLPLLSLLLAIWGCGFGGLHGAPTLPVTHRPASELRLMIQITGQYSDRPSVGVLVRMFEGTNPNEVALPPGARLTCNGSDMTPRSPVLQLVGFSCPHQPPGGSYQITYTDEHGVPSTVAVPVPLGTFAILSPLAGATVPIPTNDQLRVRYSIPVPPTNGSVAIDSVAASCMTSLTPCDTVYATIQHDATPTPGMGAASSVASCVQRGSMVTTMLIETEATTPVPGSTPTPGATLTPGPTPPPPTARRGSATVTQSGNGGTILLMGDYTRFEPGPGTVELSVEARVTPDHGGFADVTFEKETLHAPITWAR
jgi:hypothetical protein